MSNLSGSKKKIPLVILLAKHVLTTTFVLATNCSMQRSNYLLITLLLLTSSTINAQFSKSVRMVGATVASVFYNSGNSDQTVTSIGSTSGKITGYGVDVTPMLGWFVSDNTAAGFSFLLNPYGDKETYQENGSVYQKDKANYFNIGLGGFVRTYFRNSGSFLPFGEFSINGGMSNVKKNGFFYGGGTGQGAYKDTYDSKSIGGVFGQAFLTAGVTKLLNPHTGLDLFFSYNFYYTRNVTKSTRLRDVMIDGTIDETLKNETTTRLVNNKFVVGIGFQVFLAKKKK